MMFRPIARALPVAFRADLAEEAPGFTAGVRCNATPRYSHSDFLRTNLTVAPAEMVAMLVLLRGVHGVVHEGTVQS